MTSLNPVLKIKEQIYEQFIGSDMTNKEKYDRAIEMLKLVSIPSPERVEESISCSAAVCVNIYDCHYPCCTTEDFTGG